MDKFVSIIKKKYKGRCVNREKQWPPCHSNKLIRLQLVQRKKGEGYSGKVQRGQNDEAVKRSPLAYGDLFKVEGGERPVRKVLVEGDAGIGKTTLSISVSEDWACEELFQEFELLLLLQLRHKIIASADTLPELLKLLHPSPGVCESVASYLEEEEEKVLIIADGWDEVGESQQQEDSFLYQLLFEKYPLMSVVVTSRPSASAPLHSLPCIDRFVEINGFNSKDIREYIQSEFISEHKKADRLVEQLESNPLVESVCSVPLNCAIICHLWRTLEEALPSTMTELYSKVIRHVVLRNIRKHEPFKNILSLPDFHAVPKDLQQSFYGLCKFAFHALEKDQIVFSQEELDEFCPQGLSLSKDVHYFGLLQSATAIVEDGYGVSFHFLHLTFMEYLAALHLAKLPQTSQLDVFSLHSGDDRFTMVWRFFFGIQFSCSKVEAVDVKQIIQCVVHGVLHGALTACHCAFEVKNDLINAEVVQTVCNRFMLEFGYPHTTHDCVAVLYVLAHIEECSGLKINFSNTGIRENQIRTLMDVLSSKHGKLQVETLDLSDNKLTGRCVCDLIHRALAAFQSLRSLALGGNRIEGDDVKFILRSLCKCYCSGFGLLDLDLSHIPLGVSGLKVLEGAVCEKLLHELQYLYLDRCLTSDAHTNAAWLTTFIEALSSHCPDLRMLDLSENNLGVPGASALARIVSRLQHHSPSDSCTLGYGLVQPPEYLSHLYLNKTSLGDGGVTAFCESLEGVCTFESLDLSENDIHATGVSCLVDAVCSGKIVISYEVKLDDNPLGLEGCVAVCRMLSSSHCQAWKVDLSRCKLTTVGGGLPATDSLNVNDNIRHESIREVGQQLCQMTQKNSITYLYLHETSFTREGIHILAGFMYLCVSLNLLYTDNCGITSVDLKQLLTQLKSSSLSPCTKLDTWSLSNNRIDDSGVSALIDYLPSLFPSLGCGIFKGTCIYINMFNDNPISKEMKLRLKKVLERRQKLNPLRPLPLTAAKQPEEGEPTSGQSVAHSSKEDQCPPVTGEGPTSSHPLQHNDSVKEVDQTSGHHTDHCSTPSTKELLSRSKLEGPVTDDLRPPAPIRLKSEDEAASSQSVGVDSLASSEEEWFSVSDASSPPDDLRELLQVEEVDQTIHQYCSTRGNVIDDLRPPAPIRLKLEGEPASSQSVGVCPQSSLTENNLVTVQEAVWEARAVWRNIGLQLGLSPGTLDAIEKTCNSNTDDCFTRVLNQWLRGSGRSWSDLARALRTPTVGYEQLAEQLLSRYPSS